MNKILPIVPAACNKQAAFILLIKIKIRPAKTEIILFYLKIFILPLQPETGVLLLPGRDAPHNQQSTVQQGALPSIY